jgi:hypothetical protein
MLPIYYFPFSHPRHPRSDWRPIPPLKYNVHWRFAAIRVTFSTSLNYLIQQAWTYPPEKYILQDRSEKRFDTFLFQDTENKPSVNSGFFFDSKDSK